MGFVDSIKKFLTARAYFAASIRPGIGNGEKPRPFNYDAAVRECNHWVYAAAIMNATAVANVPRRLYVRRRPGARKLYATRPVNRKTLRYLCGDANIRPNAAIVRKVTAFGLDIEEVIEPHPAQVLLSKVNPWFNDYDMTVLRMLDLQNTGNAYWHVVQNQMGTPAELWRMPPQWVKIIPDQQQYIRGYTYGLRPNERTFRPSDVVHFKRPNDGDLFYGKGWVEAAWTAIGLHGSKRTMDLSKFDNMARPDHLLIGKGNYQQEQLDAFERKLNAQHRGPSNAGKFLTIKGDWELKPLNWEVEEIGTATRVVEEIAAVSGVPVAILLSNDPNRSVSESARLMWYRTTIKSYCEQDEEKLNEKYLSMFDGAEDMFLAYDQVSFEDSESQGKFVTGLVAGGVLEVNEGRAELGYPPVEGGDVRYPPSGATGAAAGLIGDSRVPSGNDPNTRR